MKTFTTFLTLVSLAVFTTGCGGPSADSGHVTDPTPGGEATPPAAELMSDEAFDEYAAQQGGAAGGKPAAKTETPADGKAKEAPETAPSSQE